MHYLKLVGSIEETCKDKDYKQLNYEKNIKCLTTNILKYYCSR